MQQQYFTGTRGGNCPSVTFQDALLNPNAPYGGLYTLKNLPTFSKEQIQSFTNLNYASLAKNIFQSLGLGIKDSILENALKLYGNFDNPEIPAPLEKINETLYIQKLYCGPTRAFKDMALQPFGSIFSDFISNSSKEYLILTATSGDTGPATLQSFANKPNIKVVCIYPKGGTSDVQRLQMTTLEAKNLKVIGINGNFDDAQNMLKTLLKDENFKATLEQKNISLSAANSVNFGRIAFQILYHIYSSLQVYKLTKKPTNIIVPSGNFGNALGAFYAKIMGFPIQKIWIASNSNNILTEFIQTGTYDISHKSLQKTYSPAMDILKSSNIERVLFALFGENRTRELMENLEKNKKYSLEKSELQMIKQYFEATFCDDSYCLETLKKYATMGIIIDPHTACGIKAYEQIQSLDSSIPCILCSTAEWTKFAPTLTKALEMGDLSDEEALHALAKKFSITIPEQILELFAKNEIHTQVVDKDLLPQTILQWL
ncbi:threonine synthase [Helicobacter colisuis]|uniref:threonine synthase n=1 Tax=Helicobacter colisuis TaxID=2949739 RepID=UPI002029C0C4|nr:threonine synthase [Helicobacter colisuis]